jgi:hypothetical protein
VSQASSTSWKRVVGQHPLRAPLTVTGRKANSPLGACAPGSVNLVAPIRSAETGMIGIGSHFSACWRHIPTRRRCPRGSPARRGGSRRPPRAYPTADLGTATTAIQ